MEIQNFSSSGHDKAHSLLDRMPAEDLLSAVRIVVNRAARHERSHGVAKSLVRELENELAQQVEAARR